MSTPPPNQTGIERAIEFAGTQSKLADLIGVTQQTISHWKKLGIVSDVAKCAEIERVFDGKVRCEELNPNENWAVLRAVLCAPGRSGAGGSARKTKERSASVRL